MPEKIKEQYEKYLTEKLDAIFNGKNGTNYSIELNKKIKIINNDKEEDNSKNNNFQNGYTIIKKDNKYNFKDSTGKFLSDIWFDNVYGFHDGYAKVDINNKFNFIDVNGNFISDEWFDDAYDFKNNYARVKNNGKFNFIDVNGNLISDEWFDAAYDFQINYAVVEKNNKWNFINKNGNYISKKWFDDVNNYISNGPTVIKDGKKFTFIDGIGRIIEKDYYDFIKYVYNDKYKVKINPLIVCDIEFYPDFFSENDNKFEPIKVEMDDYQVNKLLFGYECKNENDKFIIKYRPIKRFNNNYTLCLDRDNVLIFDRISDKYQIIGNARTIAYDDNFIYDMNSKKIYLIYENQMIDITDYYNKNLKDKENISITKEINNIISKEDFALLNSDQIQELFNAEERRRQKARLNQQKVELLQKQREEKEKIQKNKIEALNKIKEGFKLFKDTGESDLSHIKEKVENIFIDKGSYKEIDSDYIGILSLIDLSLFFFDNVKVNGIDFRETNLLFNSTFNPQKVYNKDLSGCDFTGVYIEPMTNFSGVDIRGAKFSIDDKNERFDMFNVTFKDAIYDETTTYNGIPFTKIFKEVNKYNTEIIKMNDENSIKSKI